MDIKSTRDLAYHLQPNNHTQEQVPHLTSFALDIINRFAQRYTKTDDMIYEIVALASVPNKEIYEELLEKIIQEISKTELYRSKYYLCLTIVIQNVSDSLLNAGSVNTGDLVTILKILHKRLKDLHKQDKEALCEQLQTICLLLDAMVRVGVEGISREQLHTPLCQQLKELQGDPALTYYAHYASQALLHIPNDEKLWQEVMRRTFKVSEGAINLVSAVKNLDASKLLDTFKDFSEAFEGAGEIVARFQELKEGTENLLQGMEFNRTSRWYLTLRFIDLFLQGNQLVKLEQFVRQCHNKNKWVLMGLCLRLEQISYTQRDFEIQQGAVRFLSDIYQNETRWGQDLEVKKCILLILRRLANQGNENLRNYAKEMLEKVFPSEDNEDTHESISYMMRVWKFSQHSGVNSELFLEASFKLSQSLMLNTSEPLSKLKKEYLELKDDVEIKNSLDLYVPPQGKVSANAPNTFNLEAEVNTFLASEKTVLLLLGEAGAGKSTFNYHLAQSLWMNYSSKEELNNKFIPLLISLPTIKNPSKKLIEKYFKKTMRFSDEVIEDLKRKYKFVFILDGYDEIKDRRLHLYDDNRLNQWMAKVIISCRPEYLGENYRRKFLPYGKTKFFQETWMAPFSPEEIREYIKKYVEKSKEEEVNQKLLWDLQRYEDILKRIPQLDRLLSNPFILKIAMQVMPDLVDQHENEDSAINITRLNLYKQFVEKWFERSQYRLDRIQLDEDERKVFTHLEEDYFTRHCIRFNKDLAVEMFKADEVVVEYSSADDKQGQTNWRAKFLGCEDPKMRLLRYNSPLSRSGSQYRFIHKSLYEYFVALDIYENVCKKNNSVPLEGALISDPGVIRFLIEYVQQAESLEDAQQSKDFKDNLFKVIESSKTNGNFQIAAANAITILNKAGVIFSGMDLNDVHISGADLSYGMFDHTQFERADLSNVNFERSWLRCANFDGANMLDTQFGEFPFLRHQSRHCCYSPDGRFLAIGTYDSLFLYDAETLEKVYTFEGHDGCQCVAISSDGTIMVSASLNNVLQIWSLDTPGQEPPDQEPRTLEGHTGDITSVAISPDGTQVASGSIDLTVRLWSLKNSDQEMRILKGYRTTTYSLTFSPDGTKLASGGRDRYVRLWFLQDPDQEPYILGKHDNAVLSVAFSPDGTQLFSTGYDKTVRMWSLESLDEAPRIFTLKSCGTIKNMSISPDCTKVVSGNSEFDNTVRLWSFKTPDEEPQVWEGHNESVHNVIVSPDGTRVASGSDDVTVRVWSNKNLAQEPHILEGFTDYVKAMVISPDGALMVTSTIDGTVCVWSLKTPNKKPHFLKGHVGMVFALAISHDGTQLISGGEDTMVRIWSLKDLNEEPHILKGHYRNVWSFAISSDGVKLASCSGDMTVRLWSLRKPYQELHVIEHPCAVFCAAFSPDGNHLASGGVDTTVRLWSLKTLNQEFPDLEGHNYCIQIMTISPDGTKLASGSHDFTIRVWSLKNLDEIPLILKGHTDTILCLTFSPDSTQLISSCKDNTVRLWSMVSGHCLSIIYLPREVFSLTWDITKAGDFLITGSPDRVTRLWHVKRIDDQKSQVILVRASRQTILWISMASIQDIKGLNSLNTRLLEQRKTIGTVDILIRYGP